MIFNQCISFTSQIARSFDLAQQIRVLSLPSYLDMPNSADDAKLCRYKLIGQLARALKSMDNLTSLFIADGRLRKESSRLFYLNGDTFVGCAFRLKTFNNTSRAWKRNTLLPFLREQYQIQCLETGDFHFHSYTGLQIANLLPNLHHIYLVFCGAFPFSIHRDGITTPHPPQA